MSASIQHFLNTQAFKMQTGRNKLLLAIKEIKLHRYKPSKPPTSDFVMGKMFIATSLLIISLVLDYYVNQLFVTVIKCPIS
ncbi:hypothetical protein PVAP13_5NG224929 [Panicum virgatum]|uniref:Uncharacterized protein n=1 Tax=Panicum virgatum TaxID=38727 RepID=A0A8T0RVW2_PANVG|nr:hypothetical protein PVAP13_5NG224929 [Panicum virgatum]